MKNRKKPDLLVVLAAILGLGVAASVVGQDNSLPTESLQITQN